MNTTRDLMELARFQENLKSFSGHAGRPGHRGGSLPKGGSSSSQKQSSSSANVGINSKKAELSKRIADSMSSDEYSNAGPEHLAWQASHKAYTSGSEKDHLAAAKLHAKAKLEQSDNESAVEYQRQEDDHRKIASKLKGSGFSSSKAII